MIITIENPNKNQTIYFYGPEEFEQLFGWNSWSDLPCADYAAKNHNIYKLSSLGGFKELPASNDIRNTFLNRHGSSRVSGHMDELSLTIVTQRTGFCTKSEEGYYSDDYLRSTFINEFADLIVYFDIGCKTLFQYYSYQTHDSGTFTLLGTRPEAYYYLTSTSPIEAIMYDDKFYNIGSVVNTTIDRYTASENIVGANGSSLIIRNLNLAETEYKIVVEPYNEALTLAYMTSCKIDINGQNIVINQSNFPTVPEEIKSITINEDKTILVSGKNGSSTTISGVGMLPQTILPSDVIFTFETNFQRGDFRCQVFKKTNVEY